MKVLAKKKDTSTEEDAPVDITGLVPHKKHKKHKHKKHKKKKGDDDEGNSSLMVDSSPKQPLKLTIKIGGQTLGEKSVVKVEPADDSSEDSQNIVVDEQASPPPPVVIPQISSGKVKRVDEEEAWLEALEEGRLDEVDDELKKMKDPTLMTARQRALLESKTSREKEDVPQPIVPQKQMTEEMLQRRILHAKRRKQKAEEKQEKDKKQTIERLLKKGDTKIKGKHKSLKKTEVPRITYINNQKTISLSLPVGYNYPIAPQQAKILNPPVKCGVAGCGNLKKYSCSKSGVPLCSLECYRKNMLVH